MSTYIEGSIVDRQLEDGRYLALVELTLERVRLTVGPDRFYQYETGW